MKPIQLSDVKNIYEYEKGRKEYRDHIAQVKSPRRIAVGPNMSFAFENRDTVLFQIQEMIRAERMVTDEAMQKEIDVYDGLGPGDHELAATLLIEITEKDQIRPILDSLVGLGYNSVFLRVGEREIPALFDEGQAEEDRISAVQYLKWKLTDEDISIMRSPQQPLELIVRHKNYNYAVSLKPEEREALLEDLADSI